MKAFDDIYWWSNDGLRLHARDYPGSKSRPPILCMPGLTRNVRDFEALAERLSPDWRVIAIEFRGRGESAQAKDPMTYVPLTYVQEVGVLIDEMGLNEVALMGTSLGGLVSMLIATTRPGLVKGMVLNDVGPEIDEAGLERIRGYVGSGGSHMSWVHAARALAETNADVYPYYDLPDWIAMAKRLCRVNNSGRIVYDYDMRIAEPFKVPGGEGGADLWPVFEAIGDMPMLVVRGANSDILSAKTADKMVEVHKGAKLAVVPDTGHAPNLDEPVALAGIEALLAEIAS